jgi:hypothetical protein
MAQITLNSSGVASNGSLLLQSNGTTTAVTVDTAQNVGVGVTPSAWNSDYRALDVSPYGNLYGRITTPTTGLTFNCYRNSGGSWIYKNTSQAARYEQDSGLHIWYNAASGTAGNTISFTQAMTLNANGVLALQGAVTNANGVGITFPTTAISHSSSNANTLDDYEEGTFTPTIVYSGTNTPTYVYQLGRYTKVGRIVQLQMLFSWNENGSTGNVTVGNLPFTSVTSFARSVPSIVSFGLTGLPVNLSVTGIVLSNSTTIALYLNDNAGTTLSATYTDNDQDMYVTVTYEAV